MKLPMKGMNLIKFIGGEFLFYISVIQSNKPLIMTLGMSPIGGMLRIGPSIKSKASAITDIQRAERALHNEGDFSTY